MAADVIRRRRPGRSDGPYRLVGDDDSFLPSGPLRADPTWSMQNRSVSAFGPGSGSPTQMTGTRSLRRAAAVLAATTSSVSPNSRRRSAWPISTYLHPISASIVPLTSPVNGPESLPVEVLGAEADLGSRQQLERPRKDRKRRDDEELDGPAVTAGWAWAQVPDSFAPSDRLLEAEVHLQADADRDRQSGDRHRPSLVSRRSDRTQIVLADQATHAPHRARWYLRAGASGRVVFAALSRRKEDDDARSQQPAVLQGGRHRRLDPGIPADHREGSGRVRCSHGRLAGPGLRVRC